MLTINLKQDLAEQISYLTGKSQAKAEAFVDKALRTYLAQFQREKIRAETEAFDQQIRNLLAQYPEQYVAVHNGQVIDHDQNLRTLHLRVFEQLGHTPVLLKKVTDKPDRELVFRSQWGERHPVMMYLVDVQIGDLILPGLEVVGDEVSGEIVLGRDILNRLRILLDGPKETVEVSE